MHIVHIINLITPINEGTFQLDSGSKYDYNPKRCVREGWESMEKVLCEMLRGVDAPTEKADPAPVNAMRKMLTESASRDLRATKTRLMGRGEEETCAKEGAERVSDSAWDVEERMEATAESREDERRRGGIGVRLNVPEGEKERIE